MSEEDQSAWNPLHMPSRSELEAQRLKEEEQKQEREKKKEEEEEEEKKEEKKTQVPAHEEKGSAGLNQGSDVQKSIEAVEQPIVDTSAVNKVHDTGETDETGKETLEENNEDAPLQGPSAQEFEQPESDHGLSSPIKKNDRSLDENPFEMSDDENASWISNAVENDGSLSGDSPVKPKEEDDLFGDVDDEDDFLAGDTKHELPSSSPIDMELNGSPRKSQEAETHEISFGDDTESAAVFDQIGNHEGPVEEHGSQNKSLGDVFENNADTSFFDNVHDRQPNAEQTTLANSAPPPQLTSKSKPKPNSKGHNRMPSAFINAPEEDDDDFFTNTTSANDGHDDFDALVEQKDEPASPAQEAQPAESKFDAIFGDGDEELMDGEDSKTEHDPFAGEADEFDLADDGSHQAQSQLQEPVKQAEPQNFAFLEEDEDLLLSDDEPEQPAPAPQANRYQPQPQPQPQPQHQSQAHTAQSNIQTPVMQTGSQFGQYQYNAQGQFKPFVAPQHNLYSPYQPQPPAQQREVKPAKSFINDTTKGSAYDPPMDIFPKAPAPQPMRRVQSQQPITPSAYSPYAQPPQQQQQQQGPPKPPAQQKPFYEDLPMPAPKQQARARQSMTAMNTRYAPPAANTPPQGLTSPPPQGPPQAAAPPNPYAATSPQQAPQTNPYQPVKPNAYQPGSPQQTAAQASPYAPVSPQQPHANANPYGPVSPQQQQQQQAQPMAPVNPYAAASPPQPRRQSPYAPVQGPPMATHTRNSSGGSNTQYSPQQPYRQIHQSQSMQTLSSPPMAPYAPQQPRSRQTSGTNPYAPVPPANQYGPQGSHPAPPVNQYAPQGPPQSTPPVNQYAPQSSHTPQTSMASMHQSPASNYSPRNHAPAQAPQQPGPPPAGPPKKAPQNYGDLPDDFNQTIARHDYSPPQSRNVSQQHYQPHLPPGYKPHTGKMPESLNLQQNQYQQQAQAHTHTPKQEYSQYQATEPVQRPLSAAPQLSATDNEMLARRQFPAFHWGTNKKAIMVVPQKIAYSGAGAEVRVDDVTNVMKVDESLAKFPGPLLGKNGPVKSKKKELEKWLDSKINTMQAANESQGLGEGAGGRAEHKLILWKLLRIVVQSETPTKALAEQLPAIRTLLVPGVRDLHVSDPNDPENFKSASDLYHNQPQAAMGQGGASFGAAEMKALLADIQVGNREGALRKALDSRLWAHALVIAGSLGQQQWLNTVGEFVREDVRGLEPPASQSLALMYRVFSGAVSELGNQRYGESTSNWRHHLCMIISNPSPTNQEAVMALGHQLLNSGLVEAAHICFILSGNTSFFGPPGMDPPKVSLLGAVGESKDLDVILATEVFEYILLSQPPSPDLPTQLGCFPHLLIYKLVHAAELADYGYLTQAHNVYDGVCTHVKAHHPLKNGPRYGLVFLDYMDKLAQRINVTDMSTSGSSSGWLRGKIARPDVNKLWTRFVTGDDEEEQPQAQSEKGQIFKQLNSGGRPALSRVQSQVDLHRPTQSHNNATSSSSGSDVGHHDYRSSPYAPPPHNDSHHNLSRVQSYGAAGTPPAAQHTASSSRPMSPAASFNSPGQYAPVAPPTAPAHASNSRAPSRASSVSHEPLAPHDISRPGSSQQQYQPAPPAPSKTPDYTAVPSHDQSPRRGGAPPPQSPHRANPYAPVNSDTVSRPPATANRYAPMETASRPAAVQLEPAAEAVDMYEMMQPSGVGVPPPPAAAAASQPEQEPTPEQGDNEGQDEGYQPYEPPSYGFQPDDAELGDVADVNAMDSGNGGGGFFVPATPQQFNFAPPPSQQAPPSSSSSAASNNNNNNNNTPEPIPEDDEEVEDLGFGNAPAKPEREDKADKQEEERKEMSKKKSGWFGWLRGGGDADDKKDKAVKAKLGEENKFYYDKDLKRWVNKDAPPEPAKSAAPPPPPKSKMPAAAAPLPTSSSSSTPPPGGGGPPRSSSGSVPPPSNASAPTSSPPPPSGLSSSQSMSSLGGLDDILGGGSGAPPPPPGGGGGGRKKKAKPKYVDVFQQQQQGS